MRHYYMPIYLHCVSKNDIDVAQTDFGK